MHARDRGRPRAWLRAVVACAALALVLGLPACAGPGLASRSHAARAEWQASAVPAVREGDGDPFAGAAELSREALVGAVLERNPSIRAARHAWKAALERYPQVTALEDPMLGLGTAPLSFGSDEVDDAGRIDVSQRLPFPGKLALRGEAALAEAEAASQDHAAVRLRLAGMASRLFDEYVLAIRSLEINAEHLALLEELQQIARVRYEAGEAAHQDPIQAEVELTHAIHRQVEFEANRRVVAQQIAALLHWPSEGELPPPARAPAPGAIATPPDRLVDEAFGSRPELAAAAARVAAEQARLDLARRDYLPDFTLAGAYDTLWQERDLQPFVGVQLNVPLQLGRRKAAVEEARARLEQARDLRLAEEDEVRLGVRSGVDRLAEAQHLVHLMRDRLLPAARDHVEAARSGFEAGRNDFPVLIESERNLLDVELGYEESLAGLGRRRAELDRALGRIPGLGW